MFFCCFDVRIFDTTFSAIASLVFNVVWVGGAKVSLENHLFPFGELHVTHDDLTTWILFNRD